MGYLWGESFEIFSMPHFSKHNFGQQEKAMWAMACQEGSIEEPLLRLALAMGSPLLKALV